QGTPDHREARDLFGRAEVTLKEEVTERQVIPELMKPWETVSMAEVYFSQGEFKTAFEICRTLMDRDPLDERARRLYEKVGKILLERWGG
ncbi:MAG: hypothetical protein Q7S98_05215, partial [Deltaproteobacteria bacterium]|nr:hypothetical protein [Deltaproteobacteria bacterium]